MISGERKKFGLTARRSIRPEKLNACVANTGHLTLEGEHKGTFLFDFDESFVTFVGTQLIRGVSPYNPAYILVTRKGSEWTVWAKYVSAPPEAAATILWRGPDKPQWIPEV